MSSVQTIASLLPSATEICFKLEIDHRIVGISHECDYPAQARTRTVLTRAHADAGDGATAIHQPAGTRLSRGLALYDVDEEQLARLAPDVIITQDTCDACAVALPDVAQAVANLTNKPVEIVSLAPQSFPDVLECIRSVGRAARSQNTATALVGAMRDRLDNVHRRTESLAHPRTLVLEWLDPPMVAGHWTPTLIRMAGGDPVLGRDGAPARATTWEAIAAADPDVVLLVPHGFRVQQTLAELPTLYANPTFAALRAVREGRVAIIDGNAYFNRPGPRLVESAQLAAAAIHPRVFGTAQSADDLVRVEPAP